jgi:hypothetical protein
MNPWHNSCLMREWKLFNQIVDKYTDVVNQKAMHDGLTLLEECVSLQCVEASFVASVAQYFGILEALTKSFLVKIW